MPRGVRRSLQDRINDINISIDATEEQLKHLKAQKKEIEKEIRNSHLKKLLEVMEEKQMTPADLIDMMMGDKKG